MGSYSWKYHRVLSCLAYSCPKNITSPAQVDVYFETFGNDSLIFVQVLSWYRLATNHRLKGYWPNPMTPRGVTMGLLMARKHCPRQWLCVVNQQAATISCIENIFDVIQLNWINSLRPRQNCRHFADDIFKFVSMNQHAWISLKISLMSIAKFRFNNIPALF